MNKHKDSKHCSCAGCQDADYLSRADALNIVNIILKHGGKLSENKPQKSKIAYHGYRSDELQAAMLEDAGVSAKD